MLYIYKFTNKINGKIYIGQTNDITKRLRGHKSDMNNRKSHSYNDAFHSALRKYGWDNFTFEIIETIDDSFGRDYLNEREKYFITYFHSRVKENGYNITEGGDGAAKGKLSFSECCALSKVLDEPAVRDIQQMLIDGYQYFEIKKKYPVLSDTFLTNINTGLNFVRDDLTYPLTTFHSRFSKESHDDIIRMLKAEESYDTIVKKYGISRNYLSQVNHGTRWFNKNETYPLSKQQNCGRYVHDLKKDLIFSGKTIDELAKKYDKSQKCVSAINCGRSRKDDRFIYPLKKNAEKNKQIWNTLF